MHLPSRAAVCECLFWILVAAVVFGLPLYGTHRDAIAREPYIEAIRATCEQLASSVKAASQNCTSCSPRQTGLLIVIADQLALIQRMVARI